MGRRKKKLTGTDVTHDKRYEAYQRHLKLQGYSPATINSYKRAFRFALIHFGDRLDCASRDELGKYFEQRLKVKSVSTVSIDVFSLKFYFCHVIQKPWEGYSLVKAPRVQKLPDIITVEEVQRIIDGTRCLSYRVFYFTIYSMGLRLTEGLKLRIEDIDAKRERIHVRRGKGQKDRLVPMSPTTLNVLRRFWSVHKNPNLIFPNRAGGLQCSAVTDKPLDSSGIQKALHRVSEDMGIKKTLPLTVFATVTPLI